MSDKGIILSEKHGVNPSLLCCALCGKDIGIALMGRLKGDVEAPKRCCDGRICDDCKKSLEDKKERCFIDFSTGKYIKLPDESLSQDYLNRVKDTRYIPLPPDNFRMLEGMLSGENPQV